MLLFSFADFDVGGKMRITAAFLCTIAMLMTACYKKSDTDTIRLFIQASEAYAHCRFAEVSKILQKENRFPPSLMLRAKAEYFSGDLEKAEKTCRRIIKLRPSKSEAHLYLARILREKGDLIGALKITENMLADNPQDIRVLRLAANLAMESEKYDEAIILLDKASEFSAENAMALLDRARLKWISGITNEEAKQGALDDLSRARAMLPWDTPLLRSILNLENIV